MAPRADSHGAGYWFVVIHDMPVDAVGMGPLDDRMECAAGTRGVGANKLTTIGPAARAILFDLVGLEIAAVTGLLAMSVLSRDARANVGHVAINLAGSQVLLPFVLAALATDGLYAHHVQPVCP